MILRLLLLLFLAQAACLVWRWRPNRSADTIGPDSPPPTATHPHKTTTPPSDLRALLTFEADWDAGKVDPLAGGKQPAPGQLRQPKQLRNQPAKSLLSESLQDDTVAAAEWRQKRFSLGNQYAPFFLSEHVPWEDSKRALDLLTDLHSGTRLAQVAAHDPNNPQVGVAVQNLVAHEVLAELNTLLGPDLATKLDRYRTTLPVRADLDLLASDLRGMRANLTVTNHQALLDILIAGRTDPGRGQYDRETILRAATAVLSPTQLEILDDLLRRRNPPAGANRFPN